MRDLRDRPGLLSELVLFLVSWQRAKSEGLVWIHRLEYAYSQDSCIELCPLLSRGRCWSKIGGELGARRHTELRCTVVSM